MRQTRGGGGAREEFGGVLAEEEGARAEVRQPAWMWNASFRNVSSCAAARQRSRACIARRAARTWSTTPAAARCWQSGGEMLAGPESSTRLSPLRLSLAHDLYLASSCSGEVCGRYTTGLPCSSDGQSCHSSNG